MNRHYRIYILVQLGVATVALVCVLSLLVAPSFAQGCDDTPDHFVFSANTGDNYAIVVDSTSLDCDLSDCDEIGVYDGDLCVGASVFRGQWPLAITAWKDDTQTGDVDGYVSGNLIIFRIWHTTDDSEPPIIETSYSAGNGSFDSGPFARLWLGCPCPTLEGPDPGSLIPPDGDTGRIEVTFVWESVSFAWAYAIKIDSVSQGPQYLMMYDTVFDTSMAIILPFDTLPVGNPKSIFWQVQPLGVAPCPNGNWTSPAVYTDVREFDQGSLPSRYNLEQNYPNPFNPSTTIEFNLPRRSQVCIDIYNLLGQKVQRLVNQECPAGNYRVAWDGIANSGMRASTGVYFYRIEAEGYAETRKMLLLK